MCIVSYELNSCILFRGTLAFRIANLFTFSAILHVQQLLYTSVNTARNRLIGENKTLTHRELWCSYRLLCPYLVPVLVMFLELTQRADVRLIYRVTNEDRTLFCKSLLNSNALAVTCVGVNT